MADKDAKQDEQVSEQEAQVKRLAEVSESGDLNKDLNDPEKYPTRKSL
jgi:hypothetical protein